MVGAFLVVTALYLAKPLFVPLVLAALFTFILSPVVIALQNRGFPRVPSVLLVVLAAVGVAGTIAYIVISQLLSLAAELPTHRLEIEQKLADLHDISSGGLSRLVDMLQDLIGSQESLTSGAMEPAQTVVLAPDPTSGFSALGDLLGPAAGGLASAFLVLLLVIFMLLRREDVRNRAIRLLGYTRLTGTTRATVDAAGRVSRLLLSQLVVNASFGLAVGVGLWLLGVPYAPLWGFSAGVLRFVPYLGVVVAILAPVLFSVATSPGWEQPLGVLGYILAVMVVVANVVEPILFSRKTGVSPLALLVAAAFWTWLWGPIGLVISTPLTICLVVLGQHAPQFSFLAVLLGDEPALEPHETFYQRLLANDEVEAVAVATGHAEEHGVAATFDRVLMPALLSVRRDRQREGLTTKDETWVVDATERTITAIALEATRDAPGRPPIEPLPLVLACPAHHRAEEVGLAMLARLCAHDVARVQIMTRRARVADIEARIEEDAPACVFVGILPPGGVTQAEYLCKRLAGRWPDLPIIVGYWKRPKHYDKLLVRLREAGASYVTTSVEQARSQVAASLAARIRDDAAVDESATPET